MIKRGGYTPCSWTSVKSPLIASSAILPFDLKESVKKSINNAGDVKKGIILAWIFTKTIFKAFIGNLVPKTANHASLNSDFWFLMFMSIVYWPVYEKFKSSSFGYPTWKSKSTRKTLFVSSAKFLSIKRNDYKEWSFIDCWE